MPTSYDIGERRRALPIPDPGRMNCRGRCQRLNVERGCALCGKCAQCCDCTHCPACDSDHPATYVCKVCGACKRASSVSEARCMCRHKPKAIRASDIVMPTLRESVRPQAGLLRNLTCEVEVSHRGSFEDTLPVRDAKRREYPVRPVHDGSLPSTGKEYVCGPMYGERFEQGMKKILYSMRKSECSVNISCGLHVHVDGRDLDAYALRRVGLMYTRLEIAFFKLVSRSRAENTYAQTLKRAGINLAGLAPLTKSGDIRRYLIKQLYKSDVSLPTGSARVDPARAAQVGATLQSTKAGKYHGSRYCALNLHSWFHRGTIEFRHSQGTLETERLLNWSLLCGWFVELGARLTDREADRVVSIADLCEGTWKRPGRTLSMPSSVAAWVLREHASPTADAPGSDNPADSPDEEETLCEQCDNRVENCECCIDCRRYPCECCGECGRAECVCCGLCLRYPCQCEDESSDEDEDEEEEEF